MSFKWVKLSDVCERITDGSHFSPKTVDEGFPYITVRDIDKDNINFESCKFVSKEDFSELSKNGCSPKLNDLLFSKDGTVGKVALVSNDVDFVVLSSLAILTPKLNLINPSFLFYVLKSPDFVNTAIGKKTGVAIRRIILKNLKDISVPLPSLFIQKKIVAKLDEIFAEIDKATAANEANAKNSEALFESVLRKAYQIKDGHKTVELGDICDITGGGTPSKSNPNFYIGDIPWATVRDMNKDYLEETDFKINKEAVKESSTNIIPKNNVVIATRVGLGKVCILKQDTAINQDLRGIVPKNPKALDVNYLFFWFKSISKVIVDAGRGATVHGVTLPFIKSLQIPLPPIALQEEIVAKLDVISEEVKKSTKSYTDKISELATLKQSILKQAFNGELVKE